MKKLLAVFFTVFVIGCSSVEIKNANNISTPNCLGNTEIPLEFQRQFTAVEDESLLNLALGAPNEGKLCSGKVYIAEQNSDIIIYRIWNSTNPNSQMGQWWAFTKPTGLVSTYRSDYEICYQWSPLDKLTFAKLKPGTKIVVGTGQSAKCSEYLSYPLSEKKQIFVKDASTSVEILKNYDLVFKWQ